jgi:DNA polymerase-3 subunit epsilon
MITCSWGVLDTETTGFYANRGDKLVEIAAIKVKGQDLDNYESFTSLLNPERSIPPASFRIHQISDDMVKGEPLFCDVCDKFNDFLQGIDYLFIHNAKFDLSFLENESKKAKKSLVLPKIICSVQLSRELYPFERSHNLNAISKRLGLKIKSGENRHRALGDVLLTAEMIRKFAEDNPLIFEGVLENLVGRY